MRMSNILSSVIGIKALKSIYYQCLSLNAQSSWISTTTPEILYLMTAFDLKKQKRL